MLRTALRTLLTLNDSAERTALAYALGVFLAFSPFLGLHTVIGLALAMLFRLNKIAVLIGVYSNTPWTLIPFYAFATWLGVQITGFEGIGLPADMGLRSILTLEFLRWLSTQWRLLVPAFVGSSLLAVLLGALAYPFALLIIRRFRRTRSRTPKGSSAVS